MIILKDCNYCSKEFKTSIYPSSGKGRGNYCSRVCTYAGVSRLKKSLRPWNNCVYCKKTYQYPKISAPTRYCSDRCRQNDHANITNFATKERHGNWHGGVETRNHKDRTSKEYHRWRKAVLELDGYICIECGSEEKLEANHIKPFAYYPTLRFDVGNGETLCKRCHTKTETFGRKVYSYMERM